ncbi:Chorein N-terminal domain-containing protein [Entamoeba marina]
MKLLLRYLDNYLPGTQNPNSTEMDRTNINFKQLAYVSGFHILDDSKIKRIHGDITNKIEIEDVFVHVEIEDNVLANLLKRNDVISGDTDSVYFESDAFESRQQMESPEVDFKNFIKNFFIEKMICVSVEHVKVEIGIKHNDKTFTFIIEFDELDIDKDKENGPIDITFSPITISFKENSSLVKLMTIGECEGRVNKLSNLINYLIYKFIDQKYEGDQMSIELGKIQIYLSTQFIKFLKELAAECDNIVEVLFTKNLGVPDLISSTINTVDSYVDDENDEDNTNENTGIFSTIGRFFNYILPSESEHNQKELKSHDKHRFKPTKEQSNDFDISIKENSFSLILCDNPNDKFQIQMNLKYSMESFSKMDFVIDFIEVTFDSMPLMSIKNDDGHIFTLKQIEDVMEMQFMADCKIEVFMEKLEEHSITISGFVQEVFRLLNNIQTHIKTYEITETKTSIEDKKDEEKQLLYKLNVTFNTIDLILHNKEDVISMNISYIIENESTKKLPLIHVEMKDTTVISMKCRELTFTINELENKIYDLDIGINVDEPFDVIDEIPKVFEYKEETLIFNDFTGVEGISQVKNAFPTINSKEMENFIPLTKIAKNKVIVKINTIDIDLDATSLRKLIQMSEVCSNLGEKIINSIGSDKKSNGDELPNIEDTIIESELDEKNENSVILKQLFPRKSNDCMIKSDSTLLLDIDTIKVNLSYQQENFSIEANQFYWLKCENFQELGISFAYGNIQGLQVNIGYFQNSWGSPKGTKNDVKVSSKTASILDINVMFVENHFVDSLIENDPQLKYLKYFASIWKPRNLTKFQLYQIEEVALTLSFSLEEKERMLHLFNYALNINNNKQPTNYSNKEEVQVQNKSSQHERIFFSVKSFNGSFQPLQGIKIKGAEKPIGCNCSLFGHAQISDVTLIQTNLSIVFNELTQINAKINIKNGNNVVIYVPLLSVNGKLDIVQLPTIINTINTILTLSNPYQEEQEESKDNQQCVHSVDWDEYFGHPLKTRKRVDRKIDGINSISELIYNDKNSIEVVDDTKEFYGKPKDFVDSNNTVVFPSRETTSDSEQRKEDNYMDELFKESNQPEEFKERIVDNEHQGESDDQVIIEMPCIDVNLDLTTNETKEFKVKTNIAKMSIKLKERTTAITVTLGHTSITSVREDRPIFELQSRESKTDVFIIKCEMITPKAIRGCSNETGIGIGIYNTSASMKVYIPAKILIQLKDILGKMPKSPETSSFIESISPPPMVINLTKLEIYPIIAEFDIGGLINIFKNETSFPKTRILLNDVRGSVNDLFEAVYSITKDNAWKKLYPLLLWLLSGLFPQITNVSALKSFITGVIGNITEGVTKNN